MMMWMQFLRSRRVAMATAHLAAQESASSKKALLPKRSLQTGAMIFDVVNLGLQPVAQILQVCGGGCLVSVGIDVYK